MQAQALNSEQFSSPCALWFTGLSGSGKSTTATALQAVLLEKNCKSYLLDGDILRTGLCKDLGFSMADRNENIRRVGEVARLLVDAGIVVIAATISPLQKMRSDIRALFPPSEFIEIFIDTSLAVCEELDPRVYTARRAKERSCTSPELILPMKRPPPPKSIYRRS